MEILEHGLIILGFDFNGKKLMVSFQVFLDTDDGRSAIYVHNLEREYDNIVEDFSEIYTSFEISLYEELIAVVDLIL